MEDLTIAAVKLDTLVRFKNEMSKRYEMKDLGELHFILEPQVRRDRKAHSLHLSQKQYINTILERVDMSNCKLVKSPLRSKSILSLRKEGEAKAQAIHPRRTGRVYCLSSNTSSIRTILGSPTLEDLNSSMATAMQTLLPAIPIDASNSRRWRSQCEGLVRWYCKLDAALARKVSERMNEQLISVAP